MSGRIPQSPNHIHHLHHSPRRAVDLRIPAIEKYAYCLCLHVKPTTIFIAVFKLIRALLFASILLNTEFAINEPGQDLNLPNSDVRSRSTAAGLTILTRILMASVSAVGIYAVVSGRAALLMPLYAMLMVDFLFTLPIFYSRDMDSNLEDNPYPYRPTHQASHPQYVRYSMILFSSVAMVLKIYFLCVVWKCYRYLRLIELVTPIRLSEIYPHLPPTGSQYPIVRILGSIDSTDLSSGHNVTPPPYESVASSMKPPNYEDAIKSSGTVFTVSPPVSSNSVASPQQQQPHQQQQLQQQPQQTVVFTIPCSEQYQNVSTQILGSATGASGDASQLSGNGDAPVDFGSTSVDKLDSSQAPASSATPISIATPSDQSDPTNNKTGTP